MSSCSSSSHSDGSSSSGSSSSNSLYLYFRSRLPEVSDINKKEGVSRETGRR